MENNGKNKITRIRQIVRFKEFLQKWTNVTKKNKKPSKCNPVGISPVIRRRLIMSSKVVHSKSDEDGCQRPKAPHSVARGFLAVYVGPELRRFIIPTSYLSDTLFEVLLEKVEEEFGYDHSGALTIPCEVETFKYLLRCMETHQKKDQIVSHN